MTDHWDGWMGELSLPWPENRQRMKVRFRRDTFYCRAELVGGPSDGEIWGVQAWKSYRTDKLGKTQFRDHEDTLFYVPTYQYFFEFPFRITKAGIVRHAGWRTFEGVEYDLAYATWKGAEPRLDVDQYVLWIGKTSGLIEKVQFTVRDKLRWATGTVHFADFRTVEGIQIPFKMTVTIDPDDETYLHQMVIESVAFDTVDKSVFFVDSSLPFTADAKVVDFSY
jgi:hypothetical protein